MAGIMNRESYPNGNISEYHLSYGDGRLQYSTYLCDENDNILSSRSYEPVPAAWLEPLMPLSVYDDTRFPKPIFNYTLCFPHSDLTGYVPAGDWWDGNG